MSALLEDVCVLSERCGLIDSAGHEAEAQHVFVMIRIPVFVFLVVQ